MERFIYKLFTLVILLKLRSVDFAFALNDDPTGIDTDKYPLVYLSVPDYIIKSKQVRPGWKEPVLQIYCFRGVTRHWLHVWVSASMEISLEPEEYDRYDGTTPQEVVTAFEEQNIFWSLRLFSWKDKIIRANADGGSCVGIHGARQPFQIFLNVQEIDFWKPALLISGIILYLLAPKLSQNTLFYYICGIILGLCASLLLLVYFANRLVTLPQGPVVFYGVLAMGWFVGIRIMQMLWGNIRLIVSYQWSALMTYVVVTSLISIAMCYRMGPVRNPRTRNLIRWAMQGGSLYLMYMSSEFKDAVLFAIALFVVFVNFPQGLLRRVITRWKQHVISSAPRRLLTLDEFQKEGDEYTAKSLEELRSFCASPGCNQWAMVNHLKMPTRVAVFVTGSPHVTEEETQNHKLYGLHKTNNVDVEVSDDSDF